MFTNRRRARVCGEGCLQVVRFGRGCSQVLNIISLHVLIFRLFCLYGSVPCTPLVTSDIPKGLPSYLTHVSKKKEDKHRNRPTSSTEAFTYGFRHNIRRSGFGGNRHELGPKLMAEHEGGLRQSGGMKMKCGDAQGDSDNGGRG